jgi:hypothetical protein
MDAEANNGTAAVTDAATDAFQSSGCKGGYTRDGQPLAPDASMSSKVKQDSNLMTGEFGPYGVSGGMHSGISSEADPSQYHASGRRLGQTLEQEERAAGLNAELDDIHTSNVRFEEYPEGGSIWQPVGNPTREEEHQAEMLDQTSEADPRPHEEVDPQTLIPTEKLGEVQRYAPGLADRFDVSTAELSRRMTWKLAEPLDCGHADETAPVTLPGNDGNDEQIVEVSQGGAAMPVGYRGTDDDDDPIYKLADAYLPKKYDPFNAMEALRSELLYELPEHTEGIKASHSSADAVGVVTKLFDPNRRDQVQVGRAEDADGNEFGFCVFRNSVTERWTADNWKTPANIQTVGVGDTIKISNAKPKPYKNIMSLTLTTKSELVVFERGDGPIIANNHQSENTGQIADPRPMSRHNHIMS